MKQNFTVRQGTLDGVEAFLSVAQHRSFDFAARSRVISCEAVGGRSLSFTPVADGWESSLERSWRLSRPS